MIKLGILDSLWEMIFPTPRICILCKKKQEQIGICPACREKLAAYRQNHCRCSRCGTFGVTEENCPNHRKWPQYLKSNQSLWPYYGEYRKTLLEFKFKGQPWLAEALAKQMAPLVTKGDIIIPVPISAERLKERKFNQSALLAKYLARETGLEYAENVLIKIKNTPRQSTLSYAERQKSLQGALAVKNEQKIIGKDIILVDDICTTGATILTCAQILHEQTKGDIYGITLCSGIQ